MQIDVGTLSTTAMEESSSDEGEEEKKRAVGEEFMVALSIVRKQGCVCMHYGIAKKR